MSAQSAQPFPHPIYSRHVLQPAYDDAQRYLFGPMLATHEAHALMLAECGIISAENARAICDAVAGIRAGGRMRWPTSLASRTSSSASNR